MKVYDEYSKQQIELQNDILLSLHHSLIEWANDLLRNKYFIVKNSRVYEVEFPYLSILFDLVMSEISCDVHELSQNICRAINSPRYIMRRRRRRGYRRRR